MPNLFLASRPKYFKSPHETFKYFLLLPRPVQLRMAKNNKKIQRATACLLKAKNCQNYFIQFPTFRYFPCLVYDFNEKNVFKCWNCFFFF